MNKSDQTSQVFKIREVSSEKPLIKKTFKIPDMTCSNCAMKLESLEDTLTGVKEINASYHKLNMVIEYDESKLTDEQIIAAMRMVWERMKIIIEPSCAVPLAALLKEKKRFKGKRVGIILSGGNVDLDKVLKLMASA